jgi:hypothetical protein
MFGWDEPAVLDFWRFIAERHRVFLRRTVWRLPPPWTVDPILANTFTTRRRTSTRP